MKRVTPKFVQMTQHPHKLALWQRNWRKSQKNFNKSIQYHFNLQIKVALENWEIDVKKYVFKTSFERSDQKYHSEKKRSRIPLRICLQKWRNKRRCHNEKRSSMVKKKWNRRSYQLAADKYNILGLLDVWFQNGNNNAEYWKR